MRSPVRAASIFVGLGIYYAHESLLDLRGLDSLLVEKLQNSLSISLSLSRDHSQIVASFLTAEWPNCQIRFDLTLNQPFNRNVTIAKSGGFDLCSHHPAANDQAKREKQSQHHHAAIVRLNPIHRPFSKIVMTGAADCN